MHQHTHLGSKENPVRGPSPDMEG